MNYSVGLILYVLLFIMGLLVPRGRWMFIPVASFYCYALFNATGYADYIEYSQMYSQTLLYDANYYFRYPDGWTDLCRFFARLGFSYSEFQVIVLFISLALVALFLSKTTKYSNLAWSLLLIYPLPVDCIQTRAFLAEAICTFAICLLDDANWKKRIVYCALVLASMEIHSSVIIFFLPLLLEMGLSKQDSFIAKAAKRQKLPFIGFAIFTAVFVFLVALFDPQLMTLFASERDATYLSGLTVGITTVMKVWLVLFLLIWFLSHVESDVEGIDETARKRMELMKLVNIGLVAFSLLVFFNYNFYRFIRFMYIADVSLFSTAVQYASRRRRLVVMLLSLLACVAGTLLDVFWNLGTTLIPLLAAIR